MPAETASLELRDLAWRGLSVPCMGVDTEFEHRLAPRPYYKVNGAAHEQTGLEPVATKAQLALINTIEPDLYPSRWQQLRKLLTDGLPGDLTHPDLGTFNARVQRFRFRIGPDATAGIFVDVDFVSSLKSAETVTNFDDSKAGAESAAKKADEAMEAMDLEYPDGMAENDLFGSVQAIFDSAFSFVTDINGEVNKLVSQIDEIQDSLDRLVGAAYSTALSAAEREPIINAIERWVLEDALLQLRAILLQTANDNAQGSRPVLHTTTGRAVDAGSLAAELGADVGSILSLNPSVAARPIIPKGTQIKYYAA